MSASLSLTWNLCGYGLGDLVSRSLLMDLERISKYCYAPQGQHLERSHTGEVVNIR